MPTLVEPNPAPRIVVIVPNINGETELRPCLQSLVRQPLQPHIIVVDNGSTDRSVQIVETEFPSVELIRHDTNRGYAGGVNPGLKRAMELGADYAAPFNNDAVAGEKWLQSLVEWLDTHPDTGIASAKVASSDGKTLDSTGDNYTTWGLPYPRGRGEADHGQYDHQTTIFAASGAASLYRVEMLREVGLFDEDFFAYYEDVDLSFRAQLAGWKVAYVPEAVVLHATSTTGSRFKGFFTYQTQKNLPMLLIKNVPGDLLPTIVPRFMLVYASFFFAATARGQLWYALRGAAVALIRLPRKLHERRRIQKSAKVTSGYIRSLLLWDLPPNARRLRDLRAKWRKLTHRKVVA